MSLSVLQNATAMATNLTQYFAGTGGTAPYTYAVIPGGAGGGIATDGLYTSPNDTGVDTIQVTDAVNATAEATVLIGTPLELFCDVIQNQMQLSQGQVWLWDQKINIPTDSRLYIAISMLTCKPFSNINQLDSEGNAVQVVNMGADLDVNILSRGPEARDRKEEVILALNSIYSQSQQEVNSFYIGKISTGFHNLSEIDGAAIPYRYVISVRLQYFVQKTTGVPYFSEFTTPSIVTNP